MAQDYQRHKHLSLEDKIYLIYNVSGNTLAQTKSLFIHEIRQELAIRFNTRSVTDQRIINQIRYLWKTACTDGALRLHIFFDDICPHGFACTIPTGQCHRLHTCIKQHCCKKLSCDDPHCCYIHIYPRRLTDIFLELILFIYRRYWSEANPISLQNFKIDGEEFIHTYLHFHQHPPIPNITWYQWQRLLRRYNLFFTDKSDSISRYSYIKLWRTDFDRYHETQHNQRWYITAHHPSQFYAKLACYDAAFQSVNHRTCYYVPSFSCPLLHLQHHELISIMGPACTRCNPSTYCPRWHLNASCLKKSVAAPGQAWYRTKTQLNLEINGEYDNEHIDIMDMSQNENHFHQQWMDMLHRIFSACRHTISPNRDIPIQHVDQWMDGGFHREHDAIEIMWNKQRMDALTSNPLEIIQALIRFFGTYHIDILDVYMEHISKTIVLEYKVQRYKDILGRFCRLQRFAKLSCFNRRVSFTITMDEERMSSDGYYLILEFCNVNTFLSPVLLHEWLMDIIIRSDILSQEFVENFMRFQETTSRCYFTRHDIKERSDGYMSTAIAYVVQWTPDFNVDTLLNPNINGIDLKLRLLSESTLNNKQCRYDTMFIDYKTPKLYQYLKYNDWKQIEKSEQMEYNNTDTTQIDQYELEYSDEPEIENEIYDTPLDVNNQESMNIIKKQSLQNQECTQTKCDNANMDHYNQEYIQKEQYPDVGSHTTDTMNSYQRSISVHQSEQYRDHNSPLQQREVHHNKPYVHRNDDKQINIMKIYEYSDEEDESHSVSTYPSQHQSDIYNEIKSEDNRKENDRKCASYKIQNVLVHVQNEMNTNIVKNESHNISDNWNKEIQLMELNIDENAYVDIAEIEQKRHEMNKDLLLCEDKDHPLNKLCKYCFMKMKSEKHDRECLFIPDWIRDGLEKPPEELKGTLVFVGHHFMI